MIVLEKQRSGEKQKRRVVGDALFNIRHTGPAREANDLGLSEGELTEKYQPPKSPDTPPLDKSINRIRTSNYPPMKFPIMAGIAERKAQISTVLTNRGPGSVGPYVRRPCTPTSENIVNNINIQHLIGNAENQAIQRYSMEVLHNENIHYLNEKLEMLGELNELDHIDVQDLVKGAEGGKKRYSIMLLSNEDLPELVKELHDSLDEFEQLEAECEAGGGDHELVKRKKKSGFKQRLDNLMSKKLKIMTVESSDDGGNHDPGTVDRNPSSEEELQVNRLSFKDALEMLISTKFTDENETEGRSTAEVVEVTEDGGKG